MPAPSLRPPLKTDCRHFRGDVPCQPHKDHGVHCVDPTGAVCRFYDPVRFSVLIVKLGAIGDVIRTTPLVTRLRREHPGVHITWLTATPEILPSVVDTRLAYTMENVTFLRSRSFDLLINLDKDRDACALADQIRARRKKGFILRDNVPAPADKDAEHKYYTGIFNDISTANTKSYPQELFEICGLTFEGETYLLDRPTDGKRWKVAAGRPVVGLNTGCGGRWTSRLWDDAQWVSLARRLKKAGYTVVLLGGELEDRKNRWIARRSGAAYPGHAPLRDFMALIDRCDLVVTAVTMAMHLTIGLGKRIVLLNNIFNRHEFDLYGLGEIVEPSKPCQCFYRPVCVNDAYRCMEHLSVDAVFGAVARQVPAGRRSRR